MAEWFEQITGEQKAFIEAQHIFFVATAPGGPEEGHPNLSPKGRTLVKVLGPNLLGWWDYPGSGNETRRHTDENGRITLMFCSFEGRPQILRVYGQGRATEVDDPVIAAHRDAFAADAHPYVRQAFIVEVERVQTSCGYAVPLFDYRADRDTLDRWCERKVEPRGMADGLPRRREGALAEETARA